MKKIIAELGKNLESAKKDFQKLNIVIDNLVVIDFPNKSKAIDEIRGKLNEKAMEKEKIFRAIQALRAICTHTNSDGSSAYKFDGNDSHNDYFKCEICGKEK